MHIPQIAPIVSKILRYVATGSVLDVGSGSGRHALYLAGLGFSVTAIDRDERAVAELRLKACELKVPLTAITSSIETFVPERPFDIVLSTMMLNFIPSDEIARAIATLQNWTAPSGLNAVTALTDHNPEITRLHLFSEGELRRYYEGWEILSYEEALGNVFYHRHMRKLVRQHRAELIARRRTS